MSAMKLYSCWIILYLPIFSVLILTLAADKRLTVQITEQDAVKWIYDDVDSDCSTETRVRRHTVYNASLGQELKINCRIIFCNNSRPTITWEKFGKMIVPVNVSSKNHIKAVWEPGNESAGVSYLIFSKIQRNDSGQYRCRSGGSVSHFISVSVHDNVKLTTASWTTLAAVTVIPADTFCPFLYRVIGILVFVIIVILICVIPKRRCKGKLRKTTTPSEELPHHVYDNDV